MKNYDGKIAGVLGTVILHLAAAIIFMSFQIHSLDIKRRNEFIVEFDQPDPQTIDEKEKAINLPLSAVERVLEGDDEMLNIARNLANKSDVTTDPEEYIDQVKEELISSGKLDRNNYIDEWKRLKEETAEEKLAFDNRDGTIQEEQPDISEIMAANYQGPTRIYYDLKGRNHTYLPIPIYKCEGDGKVVLSIYVNQKGVVEEAKIIESESTTGDPCLIETAVRSALISRFNQDMYSPKLQSGTLTYHFVAQ